MGVQKFRGARSAVGYWGRSPDRHVRGLETPERVRVLNEDKLIARGKIVFLYLPVSASALGVVGCTCVKDTTKTAERACYSCYGTGYLPGYLRYLHETLFWGSAEAAGWTLTNAVVDTALKPNRVLIAPGATTATLVTTDKAYANPSASAWESNVNGMVRATGDTIAVEWSADAGATWTALVDLNGGLKPVGSGNIRLRITMTRPTTAAKSPAFEVARLRHVRDEVTNGRLLTQKHGYVGGRILVSRQRVMERGRLEANRGLLVEHEDEKGWTAPLDLFDTTMVPDLPASRIDDSGSVGPHPFYEHSDGVLKGTRFAMTSLAWNEQFGRMTHQSWTDRRAQPGESYWLVW